MFSYDTEIPLTSESKHGSGSAEAVSRLILPVLVAPVTDHELAVLFLFLILDLPTPFDSENSNSAGFIARTDEDDVKAVFGG